MDVQTTGSFIGVKLVFQCIHSFYQLLSEEWTVISSKIVNISSIDMVLLFYLNDEYIAMS